MKVKHTFFILISILFSITASSQTQGVISSAGGNNVNGGLYLSWTLGETIAHTLTSPDKSIILTQGSQQKYLVTAVEENLEIPFDFQIFPNPVSDVVNIGFAKPVDEEIGLILLDSHGKLVKSDLIESSVTKKQINLQGIPAGIYYIRLTKGKIFNVYKVVKL